MSEQQLRELHLQNKVRQLEYLLEQERIKCFGLKRLIVEAKFQLRPLLNKLEKVRKGE